MRRLLRALHSAPVELAGSAFRCLPDTAQVRVRKTRLYVVVMHAVDAYRGVNRLRNPFRNLARGMTLGPLGRLSLTPFRRVSRGLQRVKMPDAALVSSLIEVCVLGWLVTRARLARAASRRRGLR